MNANLGGTKANYYVQNGYQYEVFSKTRDGLLRGQLTMRYIHTGEDNSWPGGPYTNYVRVLSQAGSKLTGAKLQISEADEVDILDDVTTATSGPYTSFEISFKIEPGQTATIIVSYDLPETLSLSGENKEYQLYWQKQAGTQKDYYKYVFHPPLGLTGGLTNPRLNISPDEIFTEGNINKDLEFYIALY